MKKLPVIKALDIMKEDDFLKNHYSLARKQFNEHLKDPMKAMRLTNDQAQNRLLEIFACELDTFILNLSANKKNKKTIELYKSFKNRILDLRKL